MKLTIPDRPATRIIDFPRLDGGLNLWELDYRLDKNETSEVKNMWWQDGILQCRDGQVYVRKASSAENLGVGYTCTQELFWDYLFCHIGTKLYYLDPAAEEPELMELVADVPEIRGTFFRYNDWLFYKTKGAFIKIKYTPDGETRFAASDLVDDAYTPVITINTRPSDGGGDLYQPENRLSPVKTVWYNAAETEGTFSDIADGAKTEFVLGVTAAEHHLSRVYQVYVGNTLAQVTSYTVDLDAGKVEFLDPPPDDYQITVLYRLGVKEYKLPVSEVDSIVEVKVDGEVVTSYTADLAAGKVTFETPPPVTDPATNNTVVITYTKANEDAYNSVMDCRYATVYGGDQNVCIVLGGCPAQPNAFFWNGNDSLSMNAAYFPMSFYNLAGDTEDGITGFGKQYGDLLVFKGRSVGKATYGVQDVDGRDSISLTYTNINSKIGCDLPWTIQLVENNIVFCNTEGGVYIVRDTSSAYENNIVGLSRNVNGTEQRRGLLEDVRADDPDLVCGFDDSNRYWVVAHGKAYVWDYLLSTWNKPSWFYFTNIKAMAFCRTVDKSYHLDGAGSVTRLERSFMDYEDAIEKVYQFPPQFFDTYDRLKDVLNVIFVVRSDTDSTVRIQYQTDYEERYDLTDIRSLSWSLVPRNLQYRYLDIQKFAHVAKRRPGCRHVRHFAMRLSNNEIAQDLAIVSAQVYYRFTGRDR